MDLGKVFMCHLRAPGKEIKNHTKIQARARTKKTEVAHLPVTWQRRRANVLKLCIYQLSDMIKVVNDTWRCFGWKLENFIPKTYFKKLKINLIPPLPPSQIMHFWGKGLKKEKITICSTIIIIWNPYILKMHFACLFRFEWSLYKQPRIQSSICWSMPECLLSGARHWPNCDSGPCLGSAAPTTTTTTTTTTTSTTTNSTTCALILSMHCFTSQR